MDNLPDIHAPGAFSGPLSRASDGQRAAYREHVKTESYHDVIDHNRRIADAASAFLAQLRTIGAPAVYMRTGFDFADLVSAVTDFVPHPNDLDERDRVENWAHDRGREAI